MGLSPRNRAAHVRYVLPASWYQSTLRATYIVSLFLCSPHFDLDNLFFYNYNLLSCSALTEKRALVFHDKSHFIVRLRVY